MRGSMNKVRRTTEAVPAWLATGMLYGVLSVAHSGPAAVYGGVAAALWLFYLALLRRGHPEHILLTVLGLAGLARLAGLATTPLTVLGVGIVACGMTYVTYDRKVTLSEEAAPTCDP